MGLKYKFIHTADIHLGSVLCLNTNAPSFMEELVESAVYNTFKRICDISIKNKVDFLMISGDLYDKDTRTIKATRFFIEQCKRLQDNDISVFVILGNHDALNENVELFNLPSNVHLFSSEEAEHIVFTKDNQEGIRIYGQSYKKRRESRKLFLNYGKETKVETNGDGPQIFLNVGMLHTQLDQNNSNYIPCNQRELMDVSSIHYWALGHIHKRAVIRDKSPIIIYPGIPQGRDFKEEEMGYCILGEISDDNDIKVQWLPVSQVIYKNIEVDISTYTENINNISDIEELLIGKIKDRLLKANIEEESIGYFKGFIIRLAIKGRGMIHNILKALDNEDITNLASSINDELIDENYIFYVDSIVVNTQEPFFNIESIKNNNEVFKELYEIIDNFKKDENLKRELIKSWGKIWQENGGIEDENSERFVVTEEDLEEVLIRAENSILEKLID